MGRSIKVGSIGIGGRAPLALIAGPCVIESRKGCLGIAARLAALSRAEGIPLIFKASYDKANRTSVDAFRGPGIDAGLAILGEVRERYGVPVLTDVHSVAEAAQAGRVVDIVQIPAFLCRQTDILVAAGESGCAVNIKKGQFLAPADMAHAVAKVAGTGNRRILVTERGTTFGYNNLVVDMRSLPLLRDLGYPVVFDATHSVQRPGGAGGASSGDGVLAPCLARAAVAVGCDAVFIETHPNPRRALSDGANMIPLAALGGLWRILRAIHDVVA